MVLFNVGVNALMGGFGSMLNTKADKPEFKTFANGCCKRAIGGGCNYIGLSMPHQIDERLSIALAWPTTLQPI